MTEDNYNIPTAVILWSFSYLFPEFSLYYPTPQLSEKKSVSFIKFAYKESIIVAHYKDLGLCTTLSLYAKLYKYTDKSHRSESAILLRF